MKILIAEDEYYARQRLIKIIRECDMEAELASAVENGREAVDFLEQNTDVDVVLTDIIMPRMNAGAGGIYPCEHALYTGGYCIRL